MAFFNHRRLVPTPTESNISQICPPQCPFSCSPGCPPLFSPPPPPPLPPPPPPPFIDQSNQIQKISPLVIIIVSVLGSCFLVVSYYAIIVKYCSSWNNSRRRASQSQNTHQEFLDEDQSPVMDHPIWFITTVGLEQSIINSIAVCKYNKGDGLVEGTECSVCLNEFQENESLRFLPKCSHAFHIPCIDTWLRSHTNCPLCRAPIISSNHVRSNSNELVQNLNDSGLGEETQVENSENDGGLGSDGELQNGRRDAEIENEGVSSSPMNCEIRVLSDLGDNHRLVENGIQSVPVRRSVSLDFSMFCFSVAEENAPVQVVGEKKTNLETMPKNLGLSPIDFRLIGSSSKGRLLEKEPISLKRSFSSQCSRNHRSSILPL